MSATPTGLFRPIPGFNYEIDRQGTIRRATLSENKAWPAGRRVKPWRDSGGTLCVPLWKGGKKTATTVKKLLMTVFEVPREDIYTYAIGERHRLAELTDADIPEIRELHQAGISSRELGRQFRVNKATILRVVNRATWKHIP